LNKINKEIKQNIIRLEKTLEEKDKFINQVKPEDSEK
jgi:hypothetical protein